MHRVRLAAVLLVMIVAAGLWPGVAAAKRERAPNCGGTDLIATLAQTDPVGHRRIVTRSAEFENSRAIFWLIEKEGAEPSYLLGTVHLTDPRLKRLPHAAEIALGRARQVAVETYFESGEDAASVLEGMKAETISSRFRRLSDHLSKDEFAKLQRLTKEAKLARDELDQLNPWVAEMLIQGRSCEAKRIEKGEIVLDAWIAGRAVAQGMALKKLETVAEQFEAMAAIPYAQQIAMLRYALTHDDQSADNEMETMIGLYLRRQVPAADALTRMRAPEAAIADAYLAAFWGTIIGQRNERFLANARPLIDKGRVFIAVGAAHLPGDRGLVRMLREAGYRVTAADDGTGPDVEMAALAEASRPLKKKRKPSLKKLAKLVPTATIRNWEERSGSRK